MREMDGGNGAGVKRYGAGNGRQRGHHGQAGQHGGAGDAARRAAALGTAVSVATMFVMAAMAVMLVVHGVVAMCRHDAAPVAGLVDPASIGCSCRGW